MVIFLPDEIWMQIFLHFNVVLQDNYRDLEPLKTLTALSLVCRRFHHLVQTPLYRTVVPWGLNEYYFGDHLLLATALASNPHLGFSTREISLANGNLSIEDNLMDLLGDRIGSLNMSSEFIDLLKRDIIFGRKGSGVASFLLALLPRLRLMELYFYKETSLTLPYLLGGWLSQNTGEPHTIANHLHNLQELRITAAQGQTCVYIDYFESILLDPNLGKLGLSGFDWTDGRIMDMEWSDYPCNLRQLNLDKCIVDASTMRDVLSRRKRLEDFTIVAGNYDIANYSLYGDWKGDLYEFGDVLRELGQNLVRFGLDTSAYQHNRNATGKIGSLQSLKALTHLSIARNDFVGAEDNPSAIPLAEALPTSIEVIDFKTDVIDYQMRQGVYGYEKLHDEMHGLALGGQFPSLREITLFRPGMPVQHGFEREVPGWDIEDTPWAVGSAFEYEYYTYMELCMKRRDDGSERVQNV
ncbi:F-box domain-containing protein [Fusarium falciforme]|uniref:F-box domain-containing protein n=1 Tax=Fusarium falciforme TaxID=195108 RepID=UPI0023000495|nr:F-box domain-containing protein [Fusarium falciforme]WAO95758.1 F-box domain-containing protein [Fusarium falciforme]